MTLDPEDVQAVAKAVVSLLSATPPANVLPMREAMARCGIKAVSSFHRWARQNGLRSLRGSRGRYAVNSVDAAIERAARRTGR